MGVDHLLDHPGQRDVSEACILIPSANISMNPRKPDLFKDLPDGIARFLGFGGLVPDCREELLPPIVNREGMEGVAHIGVQVVIMETMRLERQLPVLVAERDAK